MSYGGERLGQGRENARVFLKENKDIRDKLENALRKKMEIPVSGAEPSSHRFAPMARMATPTRAVAGKSRR